MSAAMTPEQRYLIVAQAPDPTTTPHTRLQQHEQHKWERAVETVRALFSRSGFLAARCEGPKRT